MELLILMSGKREILYQKHNISANCTTIKIDEKLLSKPGAIKHMIKSNNYSKVFFGTLNNELQRFQFFIFLYILIYSGGKGELIDHYGDKRSTNILKYLFVSIPLFAIEVIASGAVMTYYNFKTPFLKKRLISKR
jgi:hypothetical protein